MTAETINLTNELLLAGFGLRADGDRLLVAPGPRPLTKEQTAAIRQHKPDMLALLRSTCPRCRRPIGKRGECWRCFTRPCEKCGRDTGSCFIALCVGCQE